MLFLVDIYQSYLLKCERDVDIISNINNSKWLNSLESK